MLTLHNGLEFPKYHFGTFRLSGESCYDSVRCAIDEGYLGIDTATVYRNEAIVSSAIYDSKKEIFLTTKLNPSETGYNEAIQAFHASLDRMQRASVDLLLIHWPGKAKLSPSDPLNRKARIDTWKALEDIYLSKKANSIGVSNFTVDHLKQLNDDGAQVIPMVNQFELHLELQQRELVEYCRHHNIIVQSYSPFGGERVPVMDVVRRYFQVPAADLCLQAAAKLADSVVVKSATPSRIKQNLIALNQSIQIKEDISRFDIDRHYCWNPYTVAYVSFSETQNRVAK